MNGWSAADTLNGLGILLTLIAAIRTAFIAKKTREAVERTESRLTINQVLILIPELKHLERHLQVSCNQNDRATARASLNDWRLSASELSGFLDSLDPPLPGELPERLTIDLQESLGLAHQARELLLTGATPLEATKKLRKVMASVCEAGAKLGAQLKSSGTLPVRPKKRLRRRSRETKQPVALSEKGDS